MFIYFIPFIPIKFTVCCVIRNYAYAHVKFLKLLWNYETMKNQLDSKYVIL
jgi:hypothetical protein